MRLGARRLHARAAAHIDTYCWGGIDIAVALFTGYMRARVYVMCERATLRYMWYIYDTLHIMHVYVYFQSLLYAAGKLAIQ